MPPYAHITPATDTTEIPALRRGTPVAEQETHELLLPLRPEITAPPRWSLMARALAAFVAVDLAGALCIVATSR